MTVLADFSVWLESTSLSLGGRMLPFIGNAF